MLSVDPEGIVIDELVDQAVEADDDHARKAKHQSELRGKITLEIGDRLIVLVDGRIVGEFKPSETDPYEIGHLMTGTGVSHAAD